MILPKSESTLLDGNMSHLAPDDSMEASSTQADLDLSSDTGTRYKTIKTISRGANGWVEEVQDTITGSVYAKKSIRVNLYAGRKQVEPRVRQEKDILKKVAELHIVAFR